ncbi:hypothetical protein KEM56_000312 [Ascosphaera pollenicola]|nr:hypothetical protein KEM56_000312 [Ascosphaera pollenicola]
MTPTEDVSQLLGRLNEAVGSFVNQGQSEDARVQALQYARDITIALEKPEDALLKLTFTPTQYLSIKLSVDLDLYRLIVEKNRPVSLDELVESTKASKGLLVRILRLQAAIKYVHEESPFVYGPTSMTRLMLDRKSIATVNLMWLGMKTLSHTPEYLKKTNYENPTGTSEGPLFDAYGITTSLWDWLAADPQRQDTAATFMEADQAGRPSWVDWFPVKERVIDGFGGDSDVLQVDIGGGRGHDMAQFKAALPDAPGRLIVQDLPQVISSIKGLDSSIVCQTYDFFTPQPVKGARAYHLKFIFHDWSDEDALKILANTRDAMTKGYSKLIIEDFVLQDIGCPLLPSMWDLEMMLVSNSFERSEGAWRKLLEAAGLRIIKIWRAPGDGLGLIEADLA